MTTSTVQITAELLDELDARIETGGPAANHDETYALTAHIRSLTERLEKAEKDAGRYRWLVDNDQLDRGSQIPEVRHAIENYAGSMFDSAIDAAIAQEADHE